MRCVLVVEPCGDDMQWYIEAVAEGLEVSGVGLIVDVFHTDVYGFDGEVGNMYLGTAGKKLQEANGVLATRQTDEDVVLLVDKLVLSQCLVECLPESFVNRHCRICD